MVGDTWTVASAARDWTRVGTGSELPRATLFQRLIPLGDAGINQVRHEIYLVAYCREAFVRDAEGIETFAGEAPSPGVLAALEPERFHVRKL